MRHRIDKGDTVQDSLGRHGRVLVAGKYLVSLQRGSHLWNVPYAECQLIERAPKKLVTVPYGWEEVKVTPTDVAVNDCILIARSSSCPYRVLDMRGYKAGSRLLILENYGPWVMTGPKAAYRRNNALRGVQ